MPSNAPISKAFSYSDINTKMLLKETGILGRSLRGEDFIVFIAVYFPPEIYKLS